MEPEFIFCVTADVEVPEISRGTKHGKGLRVQVESLSSVVLKANQKSQVWEFNQVRECNHQSLNKYLLSICYILAQF